MIFTNELIYSDPKVRHQILKLHEQFEDLDIVAEKIYTESWLRGWYDFIDKNNDFIKVDLSNETDFVVKLQEVSIQL